MKKVTLDIPCCITLYAAGLKEGEMGKAQVWRDNAALATLTSLAACG